MFRTDIKNIYYQSNKNICHSKHVPIFPVKLI